MRSIGMSGTAALCLSLVLGGVALAAAGTRKEIKRVDLSGAPGMEVISSISEYQPGEVLARHFHHGTEVGYFIQGAMIQMPGEDPMKVPNGTPIMNQRGMAHAGFKVLGDTSLKVYTVHVVDKSKPLYEWRKTP